MIKLLSLLLFCVTLGQITVADTVNPRLALWLTLKANLTGPSKAAYWDKFVKGVIVPGGYFGVESFRGTVASASSTTIDVIIDFRKEPEAVLQLHKPLDPLPKAGTALEFSGIATSFSDNPFEIVFDVSPARLKLKSQ
jgi:hypothetical protein